MALTPGTRLGPREIRTILGAGGMAEAAPPPRIRVVLGSDAEPSRLLASEWQ
jgi:hypothetical protein